MKIKLNKRRFKRYVITALALIAVAVVCFGGYRLYAYINANKEKQLQLTHEVVYTQKVDREIAEYIVSYMDVYYTALSKLEESDITSFYDTSETFGYEAAMLNQTALKYTVLQRRKSPSDLMFKTLNYKIEFIECEEKDSVVSVTFYESYQVQFNSFGGKISFVTDMKHTVSVVDTAGGYKFVEHSWDGAYRTVESFYEALIPPEGVSDKTLCEKAMAALTEQINASVNDSAYYYSLKRKDYAENKADYVYERTCSYTFDRQKAVDYANAWVSSDGLKRNPEYSAYDELTGNANNYISQCLHAGGIPMDYDGHYQWKYYSDEVDETQTAQGRSPSWISVDNFYYYCDNNEEYGLVAVTDCQMYSAQAGDVIQINACGEWDGCVIVAEVIYDENGYPVDFLVNSNSSDRGLYPLSALEAKQLRLIKIIGWNE